MRLALMAGVFALSLCGCVEENEPRAIYTIGSSYVEGLTLATQYKLGKFGTPNPQTVQALDAAKAKAQAAVDVVEAVMTTEGRISDDTANAEQVAVSAFMSEVRSATEKTGVIAP